MIGPVSVVTCPLPPVDRQEVLRYAAAGEVSPELSALLEEVVAMTRDSFSCQVCYRTFPLTWQADSLDLGFASTGSRSLRQALSGCDRVTVFAATLGIALDRQILRFGKTAPAKALLLQALGAERIEALCDAFCRQAAKEAAARNLTLTDRFSPGYGDLPLTLQRDIFQVLNCPGTIGLTLNESLMMSPSKSVTAIMGLGQDCTAGKITGCSRCEKTDCIHRRTL